MPAPKPKQATLPEMPGPSIDAVERAERFANAMEELHAVISEMLEGLPTRNNGSSSFSHGEKIKGDHLQVSFQPGKH